MLRWVALAPTARLLRQLVEDGVPVTHQRLDALPPSPSVLRLRDLLVRCTVLPAREGEYLHRVDPWLRTLLADLPPHHAGVLAPFARWYLLPRARRSAHRRGIGDSAVTTIPRASWPRHACSPGWTPSTSDSLTSLSRTWTNGSTPAGATTATSISLAVRRHESRAAAAPESAVQPTGRTRHCRTGRPQQRPACARCSAARPGAGRPDRNQDRGRRGLERTRRPRLGRIRRSPSCRSAEDVMRPARTRRPVSRASARRSAEPVTTGLTSCTSRGRSPTVAAGCRTCPQDACRHRTTDRV